MMYILNTPVLTNWGSFKFSPITVEESKKLLESNNPFVSAVGHKGTAQLLSRLLEIEVPENRVEIKMQTGDKAIVFRLGIRLPEGKILTEEELKNLPFELGLLERTE